MNPQDTIRKAGRSCVTQLRKMIEGFHKNLELKYRTEPFLHSLFRVILSARSELYLSSRLRLNINKYSYGSVESFGNDPRLES